METLTRSGSMKCVEDYALVPRIPSALITTKYQHASPLFYRSKLFLHRKSPLTFTTDLVPQLGLTPVTLILPCIFH